VFTWNSDVVTHTVLIGLQELNHQTEITLTHELFPNEESCQTHQIGWEGCFLPIKSEYLRMGIAKTNMNFKKGWKIHL
jgi:hypothetical protein